MVDCLLRCNLGRDISTSVSRYIESNTSEGGRVTTAVRSIRPVLAVASLSMCNLIFILFSMFNTLKVDF